MINTVPLAEGTIVFGSGAAAFTGATLHVYIEDVSVMDGSAPSIGEYLERDVAYSGSPLAFKISGQPPKPGHRYNVRVHISADGSSEIKKGDYITKQSYPVLTGGSVTRITALVEKV